MLGILLLIFLARSYYKMANDYEKNNAWLFGVLAIVIFYGTQFILGLAIGLLAPEFAETQTGIFSVLNLLGIGVGVLAWWIVKLLLENNWRNKPISPNSTTLDGDFEQLDSQINSNLE